MNFTVYSFFLLPQRTESLTEYWLTFRVPFDENLPCSSDSITVIRRVPELSESNPFVETCLFVALHFSHRSFHFVHSKKS